ncbi:Translin [Microstroma glucosiphilum]|uniref:Translin n=1 Tax=Pseudomicrostroma glucosiphilum TaxID=1684307 RepID=A0A316TZ55_9BASI|nr:Translin [Pseudomicrostroma glucosiphilum]PWN17964.1 Translin [Pseudomicrostroma glucosiphilum]
MAASHVDLAPLLLELEAERALSETIRARAKEVDAVQRQITASLNRVHSTPAAQVTPLVLSLAPLFDQLRQRIRDVVEVVPDNQFWKWNDCWSFTLQRANYCGALACFLTTGTLVTKDQSLHFLGLSSDAASTSRLTLTTEEYLHSIISLINDFSRLAVNAVTMNDYATPLRLSDFVKDLSAGFAMLNLKNDSLRKRFDGIKYDVKKIEEVVYDISLRGLLKDRSPEWDHMGLGVEVDEQTRSQIWGVITGEAGAGAGAATAMGATQKRAVGSGAEEQAMTM